MGSLPAFYTVLYMAPLLEINALDGPSKTSLALAAKRVHKNVGCALLDAGADLEAYPVPAQDLLIHFIKQRESAAIVRKLAENGAEAMQRDYNGFTPLELASQASSSCADTTK